jgi:hypothetical protein
MITSADAGRAKPSSAGIKWSAAISRVVRAAA